MFKNMADQLLARFNARDLRITRTQFEHWQKLYTWDAIKGISYGESFCKYFEIYDAVLMLFNQHRSTDEFENYIQEAYVDRSGV
jgi:hypothetical protein